MRSRGFTLIEVLVGLVLFILAGLLAVALFQWGVDSQVRGKIKVDTQQAERLAVKRIKEEMGAAIHLVLQPDGGANDGFTLPSPVLMPSYQCSGSFNDVSFIVPATDPTTIDTTQYSNYYVVRYQATNNKLIRSVYPVTMSTSGLVPLKFDNQESYPDALHSQPPPAPEWPVGPFAAASNQTNHYYVDASQYVAVPANAVPPTPPYSETILSLAGQEDFVQFSVSHAAVPSGQIDTEFYQEKVLFDRLTFRIDMQVVRYYKSVIAANLFLTESVTVPNFTNL